jgi:FkbM family methyltransferase
MFNELKQILNFLHHHPLAKRHKLRAYARFVKWQVSQLVNPREQIVSFLGKTKLVARKGLNGITGNIYAGLEDFSDMAFVVHFLRPEDLFADIGANAGSYTVLASGYSGSKTIAFEPVPSTFIWLEKNIVLNKLTDHVLAYNIGLGSKRGQMGFTSNFGTVNHVIAENELYQISDPVTVDVFTLDEIITNERVPLLAKIDVEGFETEVLAGMEKTLRSSDLKAIIIELNGSGLRYGYDESAIHQMLNSLNFLPYHYDPFTRSLFKLEKFGSHNTIYIRDIDFVKERIQKAKKIHLFSEYF